MIKPNQWYKIKDPIDIDGFVNEVKTQYPSVPTSKPNKRVDRSKVEAVMYDGKSNRIVCTRCYMDREEFRTFPVYHPGGDEK